MERVQPPQKKIYLQTFRQGSCGEEQILRFVRARWASLVPDGAVISGMLLPTTGSSENWREFEQPQCGNPVT